MSDDLLNKICNVISKDLEKEYMPPYQGVFLTGDFTKLCRLRLDSLSNEERDELSNLSDSESINMYVFMNLLMQNDENGVLDQFAVFLEEREKSD